MWKSAFHRRVMHLSASAGAAAIFFVRSYIRILAFRTPKTCIYAPKNRPSGFLHMEILKGRYTFLTTKKLFIDGLTNRWTTGRTPPPDAQNWHSGGTFRYPRSVCFHIEILTLGSPFRGPRLSVTPWGTPWGPWGRPTQFDYRHVCT